MKATEARLLAIRPPIAAIFKATYNKERSLVLVIGWQTHAVEYRPCFRQSDGGGCNQ